MADEDSSQVSRTGDPELVSFFEALKEVDFDSEGMPDPLRSFRFEFQARRARREFEKAARRRSTLPSNTRASIGAGRLCQL
jgi:hypothetical protein